MMASLDYSLVPSNFQSPIYNDILFSVSFSDHYIFFSSSPFPPSPTPVLSSPSLHRHCEAYLSSKYCGFMRVECLCDVSNVTGGPCNTEVG